MTNKDLQNTNIENALDCISILSTLTPIIGGTISRSIDQFLKQKQSKRLEEFAFNLLQDLHSMQNSISNNTIDLERLESLFEEIHLKVSNCTSSSKIDCFRYIFINTLLLSKPNYDEVFEIIDVINRWQNNHIVLLKILANPTKANEEMNNPVTGGLGFSIVEILKLLLPNWDSDQISRTWKTLYNDNIVSTETINFMMSNGRINQIENRLTSFGKKVVNYIKCPSD